MPKFLAGTLQVPRPLTTVMMQMTWLPCFTVTVPPEAGLPCRAAGCWPCAPAFPGDPGEVQAASARHAAAAATTAIFRNVPRGKAELKRTMRPPSGDFSRDYPRGAPRPDATMRPRVRQVVMAR